MRLYWLILFVYNLTLIKANSPQCTNIDINSRIDCFPEPGASETKCLNRGCCWQPLNIANISQSFSNTLSPPFCHYPTDFPSYRVVSGGYVPNGYIASIEKKQATFRPNEILKLLVNVTFDTQRRLRVRVTDPNEARYEVPVVLEREANSNQFNHVDSNDYEFFANTDPFYLRVYRKATKKLIFDSSVGPLIFSDQYIQFSTSLVSYNFYGLGEHRDHYAHTTDWQRFTLWNRDVPPGVNRNLYGSHPFYMAIEDSENAMGFFFLNSNAMDVNVQPKPALTFITIGGIIDFYVYLGPSPREIVAQHSEVIGKPFFPPYFTLGFHLCRWKYNNNTNLKDVIRRNREAEIPYEVQWVDIDSMNQRLDWTYATDRLSELPEIVADLHHHNQHYINIIDPAISVKPGYEPYDTGLLNNVFIKEYNSDKPITGLVWPGPTVFPDFTNPNTTVWWAEMAAGFHEKIPFDGIWIDMNEPSSFVDGSDNGCPITKWDHPPYIPSVLDGQLYDKTLCASSSQFLSNHYNLHNMYGHFEAISTYKALKGIKKGKRPFVLTRSTFPGTGQFSAHWSGDNNANWNDLFYSIPSLLNFNMFGVSMVGSDVCGFAGDTTEELCVRWMQLAAFYPFMRNHNDDKSIDQDPAIFSQHAQDIIKSALITRYTLLPYLYHLFYLSHSQANTVIRPLFFEYMSDKNTLTIDKQFMVGPAFLITPVLTQGAITVSGYFPKDTWYQFKTGEAIDINQAATVKLDAPLEEINVHVRGGFVVPYQFPSVTTAASRKNPFGLLVALKDMGGFSTAKGELYWDDGESLDSIDAKRFSMFGFEAKQTPYIGKVGVERTASGYETAMKLSEIKVFGVGKEPVNVTIGGVLHGNFEYNDIFKSLKIQFFTCDMNQNDPIDIVWNF